MTPPTDSLYKFLAVGGIVLIVFGGYTFQRAHEHLADLALSAHDRLAVAEWTPDSVDQSSYESHVDEVKRQSLNDLMESILKAQRANAWFRYRVAVRLSIGLFILGCVLTPVGFALWWWRHQRHADRLIRAQADTAEAGAAARTQKLSNDD